MKKEICRQIDELGRLVIPRCIMDEYGWKTGDFVCFTTFGKSILIHKEEGNCEHNRDDRV